jgi:CheY-like chemotaxis protein
MNPESFLIVKKDEEEISSLSPPQPPSAQTASVNRLRDPPANPGDQGAILVVDDDTNDAMLLEVAFSRVGCGDRVIHVSSGRNALQYLLGLPPYEDRVTYPFPSFILLDLAMPLMDGWGLLSHIRAISRWNELRVIVLTGSSDPSNAKRAHDSGADSFLIKPPDLTGYVDLARQLTRNALRAPTPSAQPVPELSASVIPLLTLVASSRGR